MTTRTGIEEELDALPLNRRHWLVFGLCGAGLFFEALNLQVMSFVAPMVAKEWSLAPALTGLLISSAIAGMLVGTYVFGTLADRVGRRPAFQLTVGIFSILTAVSGAAGSLWQLALARFGAGLGIGGSIPVETAVLAEFTPARLRSRVIAIWAMALPLGAFVAPLCVAALPTAFGWRGLLVIGGIPALLVLAVRRIIPETPAYLARTGRTADAERALAWIALRQPRESAAVSAGGERSYPPQTGVAALFAPDIRKATGIAWTLNFGSFFAYYGFVLWLPALLSTLHHFARPDVIRFMLVVAMAGLAGRVVMMMLVAIMRRATIIAWCGIGGMAALLGFALQDDYWPLLVLASAAAFVLEGTFSALIPLVADLYPAEVRGTGVGWAGGMGRLGTVLAPLATGLLVTKSGAAAVILLACGSLIAAVAARYAMHSRTEPAGTAAPASA